MGNDEGAQTRQQVQSSTTRGAGNNTTMPGTNHTSIQEARTMIRSMAYDQPGQGDSTGVKSTAEPSQPRAVASATAATGAASAGEEPSHKDLTDNQIVDPNATSSHFDSLHQKLHLTGGVISATFCMPFEMHYCANGTWELRPRAGTSALFDSFTYLASDDSKWRHTILGWTGEIESAPKEKPPPLTPAEATMNTVPLNSKSVPVPLNTNMTPTQPGPEVPELRISAAARVGLQRQLRQAIGGLVEPVWLPDDVDDQDVMTLHDQDRWRKYGERELFTLFHYKQNAPSDGRAMKKHWHLYKQMNHAVADAIIAVYRPGDVVMIHDYQLMLLPSILRRRIPNMYIGFFLHVPFPSSEIFRSLPMRSEILEGVLGANTMTFQDHEYSRHFVSCCQHLLQVDVSSASVEFGGAETQLDVLPIGIDANKTMQEAFTTKVEEQMAQIRKSFAGKKIIVGRDRLDSMRGVAQKLQAYEVFLEGNPEWVGKVVLVQFTSPTSIEDREGSGKNTEDRIANLVARIDSNFGSLNDHPVLHMRRYGSKAEYFALLRLADVGLITSVRDGMNTTALEYVLCQRDNHNPLIISEFSGTAKSLDEAMTINPWDFNDVANAIKTALTLSDQEKATLHKPLYAKITTNTIQSWTTNLINRQISNLAVFDQVKQTPVLDLPVLRARYVSSTRRLFMFDYDGTLTPIVAQPERAIPTDRVIRTLKLLAADPRNDVWIISGRSQAFLEEWMGDISALGFSAEHGSFLRRPNSSEWISLAASMDMSWQDLARELFQKWVDRNEGSKIETKRNAIVWHYREAVDERKAETDAPLVVREAEKSLCMQHDVDCVSGKKVVEVRPRFVNKGEIARQLIADYGEGVEKQPNFVFCAGDDFTDEDMFRVLSTYGLRDEGVFAVQVGAASKPTMAKFHLPEPTDVIDAIAGLK